MDLLHVEEVLTKFAIHTRQPKDESVSKLAQKWLAVHMQIAPVEMIYSFISNDYKVINIRKLDNHTQYNFRKIRFPPPF